MTRLFAALALASVSFIASAAEKPLPVTVTNPVLPVEVSNADPVLVRDVDNAAIEFFQTAMVTTSFSGSSASAILVTVPAGKTLVIEHASAWINATGPNGLSSVSIGISGTNQLDNLPCHSTGATANGLNHYFSCSMQTKYYAGPGAEVSIFVSTNSDGGFFRGFVSGHYVSTP